MFAMSLKARGMDWTDVLLAYHEERVEEVVLCIVT
jgi:hypothetical protein